MLAGCIQALEYLQRENIQMYKNNQCKNIKHQFLVISSHISLIFCESVTLDKTHKLLKYKDAMIFVVIQNYPL